MHGPPAEADSLWAEGEKEPLPHRPPPSPAYTSCWTLNIISLSRQFKSGLIGEGPLYKVHKVHSVTDWKKIPGPESLASLLFEAAEAICG